MGVLDYVAYIVMMVLVFNGTYSPLKMLPNWARFVVALCSMVSAAFFLYHWQEIVAHQNRMYLLPPVP